MYKSFEYLDSFVTSLAKLLMMAEKKWKRKKIKDKISFVSTFHFVPFLSKIKHIFYRCATQCVFVSFKSSNTSNYHLFSLQNTQLPEGILYFYNAVVVWFQMESEGRRKLRTSEKLCWLSAFSNIFFLFIIYRYHSFFLLPTSYWVNVLEN